MGFLKPVQNWTGPLSEAQPEKQITDGMVAKMSITCMTVAAVAVAVALLSLSEVHCIG